MYTETHCLKDSSSCSQRSNFATSSQQPLCTKDWCWLLNEMADRKLVRVHGDSVEFASLSPHSPTQPYLCINTN